MNYLNGKTAYLCGAIHGLSDDGIEWRDSIKPKLADMGIVVLDPCDKKTADACEVGDDKLKFRKLIMEEKWGEVKEKFWPVVRYDLRCCDKSDFLILNYDPDIPTIGTVHELVVSNFEKKPILLKYSMDKLNRFNPWMCVFIKEHHFFSEWDTMLTYLGKVNDGVLDTSLWVI